MEVTVTRRERSRLCRVGVDDLEKFAGDLYGAVVAGGIVFAFLFQVFVNVGMTMGIAPVTGIPLPFVTVGGSSMVANLLAVGVLQSIHARGLHEGGR